ncbi:MAG: hypothetical protein IPP71_22190 [Bacteroidetes bacterium]|nr:hypothetical protein [Bacteroidota bacterium]
MSKESRAVNASMPVKSAIPALETFIYPLKADASVTCISPSPLVFIEGLFTSAALNAASGMFTICALARFILTMQMSVSKCFFILLIF